MGREDSTIDREKLIRELTRFVQQYYEFELTRNKIYKYLRGWRFDNG